jgi:capsule polysaccharide export protein KpsE/RkpR
MDLIDIQNRITVLAKEHANTNNDIENLKDTDWLEQEALDLITEYCEKMNYQINGFPLERKEDLKDDENIQEYYRLYIDELTISKEDVANLHWYWVNSFWPEEYQNKSEFILSINNRLNGGFYDITL